ncbi:hypothetical protein CYMTET_27593, partial [Cymbomonas tetramitiformis]
MSFFYSQIALLLAVLGPISVALPDVRSRVSSPASASSAASSVAQVPPKGWNSWDAFGAGVNETEFLDCSELVANNLLTYGFDTVTVDMDWYKYGSGARITVIDKWGRPQPAIEKWPRGFRPVADKVHSMGLKFGVHIVLGVHKSALVADSPIKGGPDGVTVNDVVDLSQTCGWYHDVYGLNMTVPGAQEFYDSVIGQLVDWGVDFIKHDCVFGGSPALSDIHAVANAIRKTGKPLVYSLSPGSAYDPLQGLRVQPYANMYRISRDFHGSYPQMLMEHFPESKQNAAAGLIGGRGGNGRSWPDLDMLPPNLDPERSETASIMILWAIARSPLIWGGDPRPGARHHDPKSMPVLQNRELLRVSDLSSNNRELWSRPALHIYNDSLLAHRALPKSEGWAEGAGQPPFAGKGASYGPSTRSALPRTKCNLGALGAGSDLYVNHSTTVEWSMQWCQ